MNALQFLWILSILAICGAIKIKKSKTTVEPKSTSTPKPDKSCNQPVCSLDDIQCVTKGGNNAYKNVVVDPLCIQNIVGPNTNGSASYTLIKIEIKGLKSCYITELAPNVTSQTFKSNKCCSRLLVNFIYQVRDPSGGLVNTTRAVTADNVVAQSTGDFGIYIGTDNLPHFSIKVVSAIIQIRGNFTIDNTTQKPNNSTTPLTATQEANIKNACLIIIKVAVGKIIEAINNYCGKNSLSAVLPKE